MKNYGVFDIIGPAMIGPSSSHTAGAVRLGALAGEIYGHPPGEVKIRLYGSFAKTYRGHGTDLALVGGLLGMGTGDENLRNSFAEAEKTGMKYEFIAESGGEKYHPNTVGIDFYEKGEKVLSVTGSSIGGGSVVIREIDGREVMIRGELPAVVCFHNDRPGVISLFTEILAAAGINIAFMQVFRTEKNRNAVMIIETDEKAPPEIISELKKIKDVSDVRTLNPV